MTRPDRPTTVTAAHWALVTVVASVLHFARLPSIAYDTMYAEDGGTFVQGTLTGDHWLTPYAGYMHAIPRMIASVVTSSLPISWWAWGVGIGAALTIGAISGLAFVVSRQLGATTPVAIAAAAFPVLLPVAGIESLANISNLHSYMPYGIVFALLAAPRHWLPRAVLAIATAAMVATEIQALLLAPLAAVLLWRSPRVRWPAVLGYAIGAIIQVVAYFTSARDVSSGGTPPVAVVRGFLFDVVLGSVMGRTGVAQRIVSDLGWWIPLGMLVVWLIVMTYILRPHPARLALAWYLIMVAGASWTMSQTLNNFAAVDFIDGPFKLVRWGTLPALLYCGTALLVAGTLADQASRRTRTIVHGALLTLLAFQALSFQVPSDRTGVFWSTEIDRAEQACGNRMAEDTVTIPILPGDWVAELPCEAVTTPQ